MAELPARDLLALARDLLVRELIPLLPEDRRADAGRVARAMAIAEREGFSRDETDRLLAEFYSAADASGAVSPLHRLAAEIRDGVADGTEQRARAARELLWRLTISQLREANPKYLADNGFD